MAVPRKKPAAKKKVAAKKPAAKPRPKKATAPEETIPRAKAPAAVAIPTLLEVAANPVVGRGGQRIHTDLALDLSSSCVGWAIGARGKYEQHGKQIFRSTAGVAEKLVAFETWLAAMVDAFWPQSIVIERPQSRRGNTTIRHAEILGAVRKVWYQKTGQEIPDEALIPALTVKKTLGVRRGRNHSENKQIMVTKINTLYGLSQHFDPNSKVRSDDDAADAIALLTAKYRRSGAGGH